MNKALTYYSIIISSFFMALIFATATTYTQLGIAVALFPVFSFFILKILPRKHKNNIQTIIPQPQLQPQTVPAIFPVAEAKYEEKVEDIDKRTFLKIISAAGISLFITSIFARRTESLIFGQTAAGPLTLRDTTGKKIDPVEKQPTDGYQITEIDDSITAYFGFTNKEGAWFIMRQETDSGSFRYSKGDSNFTANWRDRANLEYFYFQELFK